MRRLAQSRIRPKVSTMPRQASESAAFLDIYKLVIEKKRLQQELQGMEQRRQQILDRLEILEGQVAGLEQTAHHLRQPSPISVTPKISQPPTVPFMTDETLETLFLEY